MTGPEAGREPAEQDKIRRGSASGEVSRRASRTVEDFIPSGIARVETNTSRKIRVFHRGEMVRNVSLRTTWHAMAYLPQLPLRSTH